MHTQENRPSQSSPAPRAGFLLRATALLHAFKRLVASSEHPPPPDDAAERVSFQPGRLTPLPASLAGPHSGSH